MANVTVLRFVITVALIMAFAHAAVADEPSVGEQWEKALLDAKKRSTLPGPKPGQRCLWSERLGACLWYTPGKLDLRR